MDQLIRMIEKTQAGDEEAFTWLYMDSQPYIYKKCKKLGASDADAQDIVQEVMIKVYGHIQNLRDPQCYQGWMTRIITNTFNNYYRKKNRYIAFPEEFEVKEEREYMLPDTCVEALDQQRRIQHAISPLKQPFKEVLVLFYLKEMSEKEIADTIHRPLGTVKSRLYTARAKMRDERVYL